MGKKPQAGDEFRVKFPFYVDVYNGQDDSGPYQEEVWIPGCRSQMLPPDDCECVAQGEGEMVLTVVDTFKPGKYPERVFYTRKFIDPDGKEFGRGKLRMTTIPAFMRRCSGYYYEYRIS